MGTSLLRPVRALLLAATLGGAAWWGGAAAAAAEPDVVPVHVKRILLVNQSPAVLLVDEPEERFLLVFIDFFMADAIQMGLRGRTLDRPLTHDLIGIFLRQLQARVTRVTITALKKNTYYAMISLHAQGRATDIDARPSDALAIAVRSDAPIYAASALLEPYDGRVAPPAPPAEQPPTGQEGAT